MQLGAFTLHTVSDGTFGLDGGAMFGIVPRVLWERTDQPDERNRILLALNPLLVDTRNELILIDTGIGDKFDQRFENIYRIDKSRSLESSLRELKIAPSDIEIVIDTHLHFDHCGGNTCREGDCLRPRFPGARYYVHEDELALARTPDAHSRGSYLADDFRPLVECGQLVTTNQDRTSIADGVEVLLTRGHTTGHQIVLIRSGAETAVFWGDLVPTTSHLPLPYIMAYDMFPMQTLAVKADLLRQASEENWLCAFEHDVRMQFARVRSEHGKYIWEPAA